MKSKFYKNYWKRLKMTNKILIILGIVVQIPILAIFYKFVMGVDAWATFSYINVIVINATIALIYTSGRY